MVHQVFIVLSALLLVVVFHTASARPAAREPRDPAVMCKLPEVRGHCRALLPRWKYDPDTGKCHEFQFGGCDGNSNNFMTQKSCMASCAGVQ